MKLIINDESIKSRKRNCYEIIVTFMFGDCDGYDDIEFTFTDEEYNDSVFKKEVHEFIKHIQSCIKIDSNGRGGFENSSEAIKWYGLGIDWRNTFEPAYKWGKYCENSLDYYDDEIDGEDQEKINELGDIFTYDIPRYDGGWLGSYNNLEIKHYDQNGDIYDVKIEE